MMTGSYSSLLPVAALVLGGCDGTIYKKDNFGDLDSLSIDARQRLAFVGDYKDEKLITRRAVCVEPSPDAAVARAAALAAGGSSPVASAKGDASIGAIDAALSGSSSEAVASLGLRTQTIQLLRDGYYRACEGLLN